MDVPHADTMGQKVQENYKDWNTSSSNMEVPRYLNFIAFTKKAFPIAAEYNSKVTILLNPISSEELY